MPIALLIHIITGGLGLLSGTIELIRKKGDKPHKLNGKIFVIALFASSLSAMQIATVKNLEFLMLIGFFTLFLTGSGYLYIQKNFNSNRLKIFSGLMIYAGIYLLIKGVRMLFDNQSFGITLVVFAGIGLSFVYVDWFRPVREHRTRVRRHLQRLCGAYISALTAFLVVNLKTSGSIPAFIPWLLPTILITPLIIRWSRQWQSTKNTLE